MGIGVSIFLLAVGAILAFAVEVTAEGVNLNTVGVILMVVGGIGLLFSMLFWSSWSPYRRDDRTTVVREREYV
jgi:predicted membrane channel-forming protein YqfA (hemolysin III family)